MMEKYNEKKRNNYEMQRNVIFNAIINANRKKNTRIIPLFKDNDERDTVDIMEEREELFGDTDFA